MAKCLMLQLICMEHHQYTTTNDNNNTTTHHVDIKVMEQDFMLKNFAIDSQYALPLGRAQYPFRFQLADNFYPSFMVNLPNGVCALQYYLRAQYVPVNHTDWHSITECISKLHGSRTIFVLPMPTIPLQ